MGTLACNGKEKIDSATQDKKRYRQQYSNKKNIFAENSALKQDLSIINRAPSETAGFIMLYFNNIIFRRGSHLNRNKLSICTPSAITNALISKNF